jgi:hypothetical protein
MKILLHIFVALTISAAASALLSNLLGRIMFLSSRAEVVNLGVILFLISSSVWITLILTIRRKG